MAHVLIKSGSKRLVLGDRDDDNLVKVVGECRALGGSNLQIQSKKCDTRVPAEVDEFIAFAVSKFGKIDYCANCERPNGMEGMTMDISLPDFTMASENWQRGVRLSLI